MTDGGHNLRASWAAHPDQELFVASQCGILGFARSAQPVLTLNGICVATVQSTSPPGKHHARALLVHSSATRSTYYLPALYMTGHGDTDLAFGKTANAVFFCATNPEPTANGSVWALLQNGSIQMMEEAREMGSLGGPPEYTEV